jgi:uncharacterized protein YjiS (DUF1127 family)
MAIAPAQAQRNIARPLRPAERGAATLLCRLSDAVLAWSERAGQRRELAALSERELRDIGLNRLDVARETAKPFWRA